MIMKVTVKGADQARQALKKKIDEFITDKTVLVGIHEDAGVHKDAKKGEPIHNALLGAILDQGTDDGNIPARPWLKPGVASGNEEYKSIIERVIADGENPENALELIGVVAVGKVQQFMTELKTPPNSPITIKRKKSSNPLIDTGNLRQSVTSSITSEKIEEGI